jgi:HSP20 family protein
VILAAVRREKKGTTIMMRVRRGGYDPFAQLREQVDRQFGDFMNQGGLPGLANRAFGRQFPAINVWDEGEALVAEAELPGLKHEELDISVVGSELTIKGERKPVTEEGMSYHRRERGTGAFTRVLRLPVEVDAERVEATLRDGVLTIRMPKAEAAKPRKINVQAK